MPTRRYSAIKQVFVDLDSFKAGKQYKFNEFDILPEWNYEALASGFGAHHHRAKTIHELDHVLKALKKKTDRPALVEIILPEKDLAQQMYRLGSE